MIRIAPALASFFAASLICVTASADTSPRPAADARATPATTGLDAKAKEAVKKVLTSHFKSELEKAKKRLEAIDGVLSGSRWQTKLCPWLMTLDGINPQHWLDAGRKVPGGWPCKPRMGRPSEDRTQGGE